MSITYKVYISEVKVVKMEVILVFLLTMLTPMCSTTNLYANISNGDFKLREYLFSEYSNHTRPIINQSQSINITLDMEINQIISVDERPQQIKFKLWTRISWKNEFLSWHPEEWSNIEYLKVSAILKVRLKEYPGRQ